MMVIGDLLPKQYVQQINALLNSLLVLAIEAVFGRFNLLVLFPHYWLLWLLLLCIMVFFLFHDNYMFRVNNVDSVHSRPQTIKDQRPDCEKQKD